VKGEPSQFGELGGADAVFNEELIQCHLQWIAHFVLDCNTDWVIRTINQRRQITSSSLFFFGREKKRSHTTHRKSMPKRYSIMVREGGEKREYELLQVDNDPTPIAETLAAMKLGRGKERVPKYGTVRIVDNKAPV